MTKKVRLSLEDHQARTIIRALSVDARSLKNVDDGKVKELDQLRHEIEQTVDATNPGTDA